MKTIRACSAALIPALIAGLALTSCSSDAADSASTSTDTRAASSEAFPLTVDHFRGTTEIEQAPQRIIALDNAFLDYAVDLGGTVVGVSDIGADLVPSYLDDEQAARAADVESVGDISEPQLEKIAALDPDLILSSDVRHAEYYDQLEEIAPTVFSEDTGDTWQENYLLTGEALGKAEEARDRLDAIGERAGRIGERVRDAASDGDGDGVPDVSVVRIKDENTIRLYGEDTFSGSV
ncbi:MAG: ABC transporter substrate-binding protein, partial [Corynebacterium sp.]|nr:ABC transporter substrate-binding protein [Corynebacterium sp.]